MPFSDLFQTFSRRPSPAGKSVKPLTQTFRNRVLMRCRDVFSGEGQFGDFWEQIHSKLTYLHGAPSLNSAGQNAGASQIEDSIAFLRSCSDAHFLDFIEFTFRVDAAFRINERESLVEDVNEFLRLDDLPYELTRFIWTKGTTRQFGQEYETSSLSAYPQVIRKDSDLIQSNAVAPVLRLLADDRFTAPNSEFLAALKDHRHGDYGDCLTKCGSAFESAMKVICDTKGWQYQPTDTAGPLLKIVIAKGGLEPFLEQPLMLVATLRNRLSTAHGSGSNKRVVSSAKAEYAINATASAILLLVRETT
jgi:hypothetical protein